MNGAAEPGISLLFGRNLHLKLFQILEVVMERMVCK